MRELCEAYQCNSTTLRGRPCVYRVTNTSQSMQSTIHFCLNKRVVLPELLKTLYLVYKHVKNSNTVIFRLLFSHSCGFYEGMILILILCFRLNYLYNFKLSFIATHIHYFGMLEFLDTQSIHKMFLIYHRKRKLWKCNDYESLIQSYHIGLHFRIGFETMYTQL